MSASEPGCRTAETPDQKLRNDRTSVATGTIMLFTSVVAKWLDYLAWPHGQAGGPHAHVGVIHNDGLECCTSTMGPESWKNVVILANADKWMRITLAGCGRVGEPLNNSPRQVATITLHKSADANTVKVRFFLHLCRPSDSSPLRLQSAYTFFCRD